MNDALLTEQPVVLYDGVCRFCHGAVQFIVARDRHATFRFAAQQSDAGMELLTTLGATPDGGHVDPAQPPRSLFLVEHARLYRGSTAALRIARRLDGAWPLLYAAIIVPRVLRDGAYDWFAKRRYRWFGTTEHCIVPTPELKARFIDA